MPSLQLAVDKNTDIRQCNFHITGVECESCNSMILLLLAPAGLLLKSILVLNIQQEHRLMMDALNIFR